MSDQDTRETSQVGSLPAEIEHRMRRAYAYACEIAVASDEYPMLHSLESMRTLLANAYLTGAEAEDGETR